MQSNATRTKKLSVFKRMNLFDYVNYIFLALITLLMVYPFYQSVIVSFSNGSDIDYNGVVYFWPRIFSLESYKYVFRDVQFLVAMRNTVLRTVLGVFIGLAITSMFAYAVSHKDLFMRKFLITFGLITMYFNGGLIPTFLLIRNIGLYNNFLVYLLPTAFSMFNTMIFIAYFKGIPDDIEECASIDGANDLTIFFRIIIPIAMPVIACLALYVAVFQWNQYFDCMIYTDDPNLEVLSYLFAKLLLLQRYIDTVIETFDNMSTDQIIAMKGPVSSTTTQMATMVVTTVPILCVYPFLQKYFVKGIMVGSLKE